MIKIRKSDERGSANHGWLKSFHSFSFADYHDPQWMGFRSLRVINEDFVAAGQGFGSHPHKDMEIITYVLSGAVKHKDSMGNEGVIKPGEVQKMSAGTGVVHSEVNPSSKEELHLLQIWITPDTKNLKPAYEQHLLPQDQRNSLIEFPISIHQEAKIFQGVLSKNHSLEYNIKKSHGVWLQMISGLLSVKGIEPNAVKGTGPFSLQAGDAGIIEDELQLQMSSSQDCAFLLFDLK